MANSRGTSGAPPLADIVRGGVVTVPAGEGVPCRTEGAVPAGAKGDRPHVVEER